MDMENQQRSITKNTYETGDLFGSLKIIERVDGTSTFKVVCTNCDTPMVTSQPNLVHYRKSEKAWCKNCKPKGKNKTKYQPGMILGNCFELVRHKGLSRWEVSCTKCGKLQEQTPSNMMRHQSDCCYYCNNPNAERNHSGGKGIVIGAIEERIYRHYKSRILNDNQLKSKQKIWGLSLEEFSRLIRLNCSYCNAPPNEDNMWSRNKRRTVPDEDYAFNGIDRIDSSRGYVIFNCVSCCTTCNRMKSDMWVGEFLAHVSKINNLSNKRSTTSLYDVAPSGCETGDTLSDGSEGNDIV